MTSPMAKIILIALLTPAMMTAASAQQRAIYDSRGKVVGRSATDSSGAVANYDFKQLHRLRKTRHGGAAAGVQGDRLVIIRRTS